MAVLFLKIRIVTVNSDVIKTQEVCWVTVRTARLGTSTADVIFHCAV